MGLLVKSHDWAHGRLDFASVRIQVCYSIATAVIAAIILELKRHR